MVEQIRISPEEVRGYGNICEEHSLEDFIVSSSGLAKEKETVHGALTNVYKLVYSWYGLIFAFDTGNKQLYLQMGEADILSFGFDESSKQLYLLDEAGTGLSLGFDEDTNELYITDDAPPIVHNYSLALDSDSYTTTGSLSVSATLLDNGVAVSGAIVSFSGGVSTVTATTNSSGVATATVNFTSSGTLTASYSNVSDTATVTVQTYIFYDDCSSSAGLSNYGSSVLVRGTNAVASIAYDTTNNCYVLTGTGQYHAEIPIPVLNDEDGFYLSADFRCTYNNYNNSVGFAIKDYNDTSITSTACTIRGYGSGLALCGDFKVSSDQGYWVDNETLGKNTRQNWINIHIEINGQNLTVKYTDVATNTLLKTYTHTLASMSHPGAGLFLMCEGGTTVSKCYVKNIKAEYI